MIIVRPFIYWLVRICSVAFRLLWLLYVVLLVYHMVLIRSFLRHLTHTL